MTCFWMPGTNSLALGFRLLPVCRGDVHWWNRRSDLAAADWLTGTHRQVVCLGVQVQDQHADLVLQLSHRLVWEVSGWNEPLPLLLLLQELQNAALDKLLLPQLLLHLQTRTMSPDDLLLPAKASDSQLGQASRLNKTSNPEMLLYWKDPTWVGLGLG